MNINTSNGIASYACFIFVLHLALCIAPKFFYCYWLRWYLAFLHRHNAPFVPKPHRSWAAKVPKD